MRGHTGTMLTFGREEVFLLSNKQKVNSTRSTVAEENGVDDAMNFVMWAKLFFKQQVANLSTKSILKKLGPQPLV